MIINAKPSGILSLGREGENQARSIRFDISHWVKDFGPGVVELVHQRSGDPYPYPVVVSQDGNKVIWNITATDTAMVGLGRCELQFYLGGVLAKSENWYTKVFDSISASGDVIPDPEVSWVTEVIQAGAGVKEQAARAEAAAEKAEAATVNVPILGDNGNWFVWDKTLGEYVDTGVYSGGEAPYIGANGNWFIGTNDSGVSATGPRGPVGPEGPRGVQGEKGEAFTYEDFTQEQLNALKGAKGDPFTYEDFTAAQLEKLRGPSGKDGQNGVTPHIGNNGNWYVGTTDTGIPATGPQGPALAVTNTAAIGQTIRVSAVDENGQPTEWEAVDVSSGVASWNDLEDKPFGFKDEVVVLPETEIAFDEENGAYVINTPISFEIGKVYRVTYNGADYFCEAKGWYNPFERIDTTYLGNSLPVTYIDTHEPFFVAPLGGILIIADMRKSEPFPMITISIAKALVEKLDPLVIPKPAEQSFFLDSIIDPINYEDIGEFDQNNGYPTKLNPGLLNVNVESFRTIRQYLSDNNVQCAFCSYGIVSNFNPTMPDSISASILSPAVKYDVGNPTPYIKIRYINLSINVENDELVAYAGLCIVV